MYYYKYKEVIKDFTTYSIVVDEDNRMIKYAEEDGYCYCGTENKIILKNQNKLCEVKEIEYAKIKPILVNCYFFKSLNKQVENMIAEKYSTGEEIKLNREKQEPQYSEYLAYIQKCKDIVNYTKIEMGLM